MLVISCLIVDWGSCYSFFFINGRNTFVCVCVLNFSLVLSDLFLSVLEYNLKEIAYAADVAQLGCVCYFAFLSFTLVYFLLF